MNLNAATDCRLPSEMTRCKPGAYSIHYFGGSEGTVSPWSGKSAIALADADQEEALLAGAADEDGSVATIEVRVILVTSDGAYLVEESSL